MRRMHVLLSSTNRLMRPAGVPGEDSAGLGGLDTGEPLELVGSHLGGVGAEADLAGSTTDEADTVGVEGLVDGGSAGLGASERNLAVSLLSDHLGNLAGLALAEVLDDGGLHGELDKVERQEPDDVLNRKTGLESEANSEGERLHTQTQTIPIQPPEMARI